MELEGELQPLDDVDRLEQLDALRERDVGRVRARVGERAGLADRAQELTDAIVRAAQVENLFDDGAILAFEIARLDRRRVLVRAFVDLGTQAAQGIGVGGADDAAMTARTPPRIRTRSVTSATVPTAAYSLS